MANKFVASQTIYYLCKQNAEFYTNQLGAMDDLHYNCIKPVLEEKNKTGTWLSEQMGRNFGIVSRWMTNKVQPSVELLYDITTHFNLNVKDLFVASI